MVAKHAGNTLDDPVRGTRRTGGTRTDLPRGPGRVANRYPCGRRNPCRRHSRGLHHWQVHTRLLGPGRRPDGDRRSDLFRAVRLPALPPVGEIGRHRRPATLAEPLCAAPGSAHHARLHHHRVVRLRAVPLPRRGAEPRAYLAGTVPQPDADAHLRKWLSRKISAPGPYPDVEFGGRGRVLCGATAARIPAAGPDQSAVVAAEVAG